MLAVGGCQDQPAGALDRSPHALVDKVRETGAEPVPADPLRPTLAEVNAYALWQERVCGKAYATPKWDTPECQEAARKGNTMAMQMIYVEQGK